MSPDDSDLIRRWERLGVESTKAAGLGSRLIARWGRPHRFYHGLEHLRGALDALERLGGGRLEAVAVFFTTPCGPSRPILIMALTRHDPQIWPEPGWSAHCPPSRSRRWRDWSW